MSDAFRARGVLQEAGSSEDVVRVPKQRLTTFISKAHVAGLERLTELIEDGRLIPVIEQTSSLSDVPKAMRHLEGGKARGKLVITV